MRGCLAFLLVLLATAVPHGAAFVTFEALDVSTTAVGITAAILDPPGQPQQNRCTVQAQDANVRYRWDGTDPTTAVGTELVDGASIEIFSHEDAARIRFIRDDAVDAVMAIHCWQGSSTP